MNRDEYELIQEGLAKWNKARQRLVTHIFENMICFVKKAAIIPPGALVRLNPKLLK